MIDVRDVSYVHSVPRNEQVPKSIPHEIEFLLLVTKTKQLSENTFVHLTTPEHLFREDF